VPGSPARFLPREKNVLDVGKALLKVTFSDVMVLEEVGT